MILPAMGGKTDEPFYITFQCDPSIVNSSLCPPQYAVHFRGPIALSVPPILDLYSHDAETGVTVVKCQIPQVGTYEVWAWPDWPFLDACPMVQYGNEIGAVRGSGMELVRVKPGSQAEVDMMRECVYEDYVSGPMNGRWVSVDAIRKKYREIPMIKDALARSRKS